MSKIGIALPGAVTLLGGVSIYGYKPSLSDYRKRQNLTYLPGETGRMPSDSPTNLAWLAQVPAVAGCVGIDQTITATSTITMSCTGTLTMDAWGPGAPGRNTYHGGGGGAFARSPGISVTNGDTWLAVVAPTTTSPTNGTPSFICPTSVGACTTGLTICSGTGLTAANFVCAREAISSVGGVGTNGVGATRFSGGAGSAGIQPGGGGAAGPDGVGAPGTVSGSGGIGDNGLGGAGGAAPGGNGVSNPLGGGGGGGGGSGTAAGGAPGGGGGYHNGNGGRGQVRIHSTDATPVLNIGSGYGGGTISSA